MFCCKKKRAKEEPMVSKARHFEIVPNVLVARIASFLDISSHRIFAQTSSRVKEMDKSALSWPPQVTLQYHRYNYSEGQTSKNPRNEVCYVCFVAFLHQKKLEKTVKFKRVTVDGMLSMYAVFQHTCFREHLEEVYVPHLSPLSFIRQIAFRDSMAMPFDRLFRIVSDVPFGQWSFPDETFDPTKCFLKFPKLLFWRDSRLDKDSVQLTFTRKGYSVDLQADWVR
jgi:hypothetical protein